MLTPQHLPLHEYRTDLPNSIPKCENNYKIFTPHGSTYQLPMSAEHYDTFLTQTFYPSGIQWNKYIYLDHEGFLECVPLHTTRGTTPHQVHISPTASTAPHSGRFTWKFSLFALFCVWIYLLAYWSQMLWLGSRPAVFLFFATKH